MKNFLKIADNVGVMPLLVDIARQPELWKEDTYLRDYPQGPFGDVETIFLRFPPDSVTEMERDARDQHESINRVEQRYLPHARPMFMNLLAAVQGERIGRVMINKLKPGGRIFPHADTPAHAEYWDRFHICLQGGPGSLFRCGDETVCMRPGEVWWFQNLIEHEVTNNSTDDRIHMIVDVRLMQ